MRKGMWMDGGMKFVGATLAILLGSSTVAYGFNMNEMNIFYQTRQCPKCDLTYATFLRLKAPGANLAEALCKGINLSDAIMDHSELSKADFTGSKLFGADLRNANLKGANLKGANLIIVDFSGADLSNANLADANLKGANLTGTRIEGADFSGAVWPDWGKCKQGSIGECRK